MDIMLRLGGGSGDKAAKKKAEERRQVLTQDPKVPRSMEDTLARVRREGKEAGS